MLGLFPKLYPDELIYSVLARYYVRSGYSNYVFAAEDLFQNRYVRPSFEYASPLNDEVITYLREIDNIQNVLLRHTMFPYHCRFLPMERKIKAMQALINMDSNYRNYILFPKRKPTPSMRYCPMCAADDRTTKGETYWHCLHQIQEMLVCPIHHCYLINTEYKLSGKLSPDLIPAEIVIPLSESITLCKNKNSILLSEYIKEIFYMPIKMDDNFSVDAVLKKRTENTKYRSPRGGICRIADLYKDFADYYSDQIDVIPKQWQIHKTLTDQRYDFWEISLLGFFLGVTPIEFQKVAKYDVTQKDVFDERIKTLREKGLSYPKIAEIMSTSVDTIKNAVYAPKKNPKQRARKGGKPGRRPIDWECMDREMLPKVIETISGLKNSDKPQRITIGGVARLVGLKSKQIDKLPLCKAEIMRNCQSQEYFWAEKVLWAWKKLSIEGRSISIKQIRLKTNMSTEQITRCYTELKRIDNAVYEELQKIMRSDQL